MKDCRAINSKALESLKEQLSSGQQFIDISGFFYPEKADSQLTKACLYRCLELEGKVKSDLLALGLYDRVLQRYKLYDPRLEDLDFPQHYASKFIDLKGTLARKSYIFLFFPGALGIESTRDEDCFGIEFIDVWAEVFEEIVLPCAYHVFERETCKTICHALRNLHETIYKAAIFHEIGHRVGPYKVSPTRDDRIRVNSFHLDVLGELATDSLLVNLTPELDDLAIFVLLQRIFWFGRKGFSHNPRSGFLNNENDCWIGSYLWNLFLEHKVLEHTAVGWKIHFERIRPSFQKAVAELDQLAEKLFKQDCQDEIVSDWMRTKVEHHPEHGFVFPASLREIFENISIYPHQPLQRFQASKGESHSSATEPGGSMELPGST